MNKSQAGFGFIEMLLVLAIILFLGYRAFNVYLQRSALKPETKQTLTQQGINAKNYTTITGSVRQQLQGIQKQHTQELDQVNR